MQKKSTFLFFLFLLTCLTVTSIQAESVFRFSSIKQKSMGGAGVAITKDDNALHTNPACLTQLGSFHLKFPRVQLGVGTALVDKVQKLQDLADSSKGETAQTSLLSELCPSQFAYSTSLNPLLSLTMNGFGLGVFSNSNFLAELTRPTSPTLRITGYADFAPIVGYATNVNLFDQDFALGVAAKYMNRMYVYNLNTGNNIFELGQADILKNINDKQSDSPDSYLVSGLGIDLGVLKDLDTPIGNMTVGFTIQNLGASLSGEKKVTSNSSVPAESVSHTIPTTMTIGMGMKTSLPSFLPIISDLVGEFQLAADYVMGEPDSTFFKSLHFGIEKGVLGDTLMLRGGLNQGYVVGGLGLNFFILHLDYAYYVEEIGKEVGVDDSAYHVVQLGLLF
jgi:hypothetical protein